MPYILLLKLNNCFDQTFVAVYTMHDVKVLFKFWWYVKSM